MKSKVHSYLAINAGSSSVRFALYQGEVLIRTFHGKIDRIGLPGATLVATKHTGAHEEHFEVDIEALDHRAAGELLMSFFEEHVHIASVRAIGHRVVHGMNFEKHMVITKEVLDELHRITPFAPEHIPQEIAFIEAFNARHPEIMQVACFDTVFHHSMPRVAQMLPIPRRFEEKSIRRYGFHGLSYEYIVSVLKKSEGGDASKGRAIVAHLGNGASMTALQDGKSVDTSMGFTPLGGIPMGTRTGDLDPGVVFTMARDDHSTMKELSDMLNHRSGLLGMSELSSNMLDLLNAEKNNIRAKETVDYFCYQATKQIGAYATVLGGLDTLVFSGGMGENSAPIRARICAGLEFLGIAIDEAKNIANARVISPEGSAVVVRVIPTNEELMIAKTARHFSDILS